MSGVSDGMAAVAEAMRQNGHLVEMGLHDGAGEQVIAALAVRRPGDETLWYAVRDAPLTAIPPGMRASSRCQAISDHLREAMNRHRDYTEIIVTLLREQ